MPDPLDLTSLRCFVTAARLGSFRGAARACHLSPSAFGDRIKRLEDALGDALFARTTRNLSLSPAGERLLPRAQLTLDAANGCYLAMGSAPDFSLTLGTRHELGMSWLVPQLDSLERRCPGRTLHLSFGDAPELLRAVGKGEIDAAITSSRLAVSGFRYAPLHEEHYRFVAAGSLVDAQPFQSARDAAQHCLLDANADLPLFRYLLDTGSAKTTWSFERTIYLGTIAAIRRRALDGAGVAVLPEYFVRNDIAQHRLRVLLPSRRIQTDWFRLVWRANHPREDDLLKLAAELAERPLS